MLVLSDISGTVLHQRCCNERISHNNKNGYVYAWSSAIIRYSVAPDVTVSVSHHNINNNGQDLLRSFFSVKLMGGGDGDGVLHETDG